VQEGSRPLRALPPAVKIDMTVIKAAALPFDVYCGALLGAIEAPETTRGLRVVAMAGSSRGHDKSSSKSSSALEAGEAGSKDDERNWNRARKCSWLVAAR